MSYYEQDESGFSVVESLLIVVIVAVIGFVGWYVYRARQNASKSLDATTSNSAGPHFANNSKTSPTSGDTSNTSLQTDLDSTNSAANQGSKDMSASNDSLNDKSTLTSVPQ